MVIIPLHLIIFEPVLQNEYCFLPTRAGPGPVLFSLYLFRVVVVAATRAWASGLPPPTTSTPPQPVPESPVPPSHRAQAR